jgi:3-methyladenine DNA glycosylase/8-oxoguanine DNA glycosylase
MARDAERVIGLNASFDLARTVAPVWWAGTRSPNAEWSQRALWWVGWEEGRVVWRSVKQVDPLTLTLAGSADAEHDAAWATSVLGIHQVVPRFADPALDRLGRAHAGVRSLAAGSLFEGCVSSIVGQSISVAAAATTERRLCALFASGMVVGNRKYWPAPRPEQLAAASVEFVRSSGVTRLRAEALITVGALFAEGRVAEQVLSGEVAEVEAAKLRAVPGIGPWTVNSALLWGVAAPDAHPTGDVALLRAAQKHYPKTGDLRGLDRLAETWKPHRGWAARLLWLDLLGFDG